MPTTGQLALLILATALFVVGGVLSLVRRRSDAAPGLPRAARGCLIAGIAACVTLLVWHAGSRGQWVPLGDNFDALVWLATLLAGFVLYVQSTRPLGALDWFVIPDYIWPALWMRLACTLYGALFFRLLNDPSFGNEFR